MKKLDIIAFSGSLRKKSFNTALVKEAIKLSGEQMAITLLDIKHLPLYSRDLEVDYPSKLVVLKDRIKKADGVLIATPEYNRSIPGALKNMIDWTSRPHGDTTWNLKPVVTMGATTGSLGTGLAQYDLKKMLLYLNAQVMGQPEFYVSGASDKFDQDGNLTDEKTREHLTSLLQIFKKFVSERNR